MTNQRFKGEYGHIKSHILVSVDLLLLFFHSFRKVTFSQAKIMSIHPFKYVLNQLRRTLSLENA